MDKALFPGTFDPPSLGHLDVIKRASHLCEKLYVGIATNKNKGDGIFSLDDKLKLIKKMTCSLHNVEVVHFSGLVIDFAKEKEINFLIKGLRSAADFEFELSMALANRRMSGIESLFLIADPQFAHISSTLIREIASFGHHLHGFVPSEIEEYVFQTIANHKA